MEDTVIKDECVYWDMNWSQTAFPDKPPVERIFEEGPALARLLAAGVIFLNNFHWEDSWPEDAKKMTALCVDCSDVFAWGCSDAESLEYGELQDLYDHWLKDPSRGATVWCCKKRRQLPQAPVLKSIRSGGLWDMDAMQLAPNGYDAHRAQKTLITP